VVFVPEVDDAQLAAPRRLRVAFVEVVEVIRHDQVVSDDPEDEREGPQRGAWRGARMADPRRMTPEEHGQAHALLVRAVTDPDWQAASQALDDLLGRLLVVRRLLEAEERLPQREPQGSRRNG
jgi:5-deoxy-D-glucuronate isomerase